jgi:hypothetical protein
MCGARLLADARGRRSDMADSSVEVLRRLKASIRRWCEDGSDDCAGPIEFICEELEPMIDATLVRDDAVGVSAAPLEKNHDDRSSER